MNLHVEKLEPRWDGGCLWVSANIKYTFPIFSKCARHEFSELQLPPKRKCVCSKKRIIIILLYYYITMLLYYYIRSFFGTVQNFILFKLLSLGDLLNLVYLLIAKWRAKTCFLTKVLLRRQNFRHSGIFRGKRYIVAIAAFQYRLFC